MMQLGLNLGILAPDTLRCPSGKESVCQGRDAGDMGSVPRLGRSLGGGHGKPLQSSFLKNPMDRGTWRATVHGGHKESDTTE